MKPKGILESGTNENTSVKEILSKLASPLMMSHFCRIEQGYTKNPKTTVTFHKCLLSVTPLGMVQFSNRCPKCVE